MAYIPFLCIVFLVGMEFPAAGPWVLAYFIMGGGIGSFVRWAALSHPSQRDAHLAGPLFWWNFYAWPWGICYLIWKAVK